MACFLLKIKFYINTYYLVKLLFIKLRAIKHNEQNFYKKTY